MFVWESRWQQSRWMDWMDTFKLIATTRQCYEPYTVHEVQNQHIFSCFRHTRITIVSTHDSICCRHVWISDVAQCCCSWLVLHSWSAVECPFAASCSDSWCVCASTETGLYKEFTNLFQEILLPQIDVLFYKPKTHSELGKQIRHETDVWGPSSCQVEKPLLFKCRQRLYSELMKLMKGTARLWSEVNNLPHEDESNMTTLEELMCEVWVSAQETEITANIQDEGDQFFNSLDPLFWAP